MLTPPYSTQTARAVRHDPAQHGAGDVGVFVTTVVRLPPSLTLLSLIPFIPDQDFQCGDEIIIDL